MKILIRQMELKDIDAVCEMEEEAFSMPWHRESFIEMINKPDTLYVVAERIDDTAVIPASDGGLMTASDEVIQVADVIDDDIDKDVSILGCAGFFSVLGEGNICNIVVRKSFRRLGIGDRLVRSMIKRGRETFGIEAYTLEVRVSNKAARDLYERIGFVNEGIRPGFYEKPVEDACIYWLRQPV